MGDFADRLRILLETDNSESTERFRQSLTDLRRAFDDLVFVTDRCRSCGRKCSHCWPES